MLVPDPTRIRTPPAVIVHIHACHGTALIQTHINLVKRKTTGKSRRPVAKLLLASNNGVHRILGRVRGPICSIVSCRSRLCTHLSLIHFIYTRYVMKYRHCDGKISAESH
ncbi:hypothetical protein CK203_002445 [Vitis vinifera]|uniref:Uncharacterized protein n=1 Tax=Vitis vinifera TaxID=29760 RepID=A0A438KGV8_VITVI|nr:hypothetical protein CK203_002445 [Vitis vinifera]